MHIQPTLKNIFSQSWELFIGNFKTIAIITLVVHIPIYILLELIAVNFKENEIILRMYSTALFEGLFGILATIAIALVIKSSIEHKHISWIESLKLATNKWPKVIATVLLAGLLTMLLFLLLIVPGIIFMIYWQFIIYVVIFSDKWGSEALDYSKTIVKKRWWKTFGFALVIFLASMLWAVIIGSIGGFFAGFFSVIIPKAEFIVLLVGKSIWAVTYAFFSVLPVIWYLSWDSSKDTTSIKSNAE